MVVGIAPTMKRDTSLRQQNDACRMADIQMEHFDSIKIYNLDQHEQRKITHYENFAFPIQHMFWRYQTSSEKIYGLARLKSGDYVYFKIRNGLDHFADVQLKLYISQSHEKLIEKAMSELVYEKYIKQTEPTV